MRFRLAIFIVAAVALGGVFMVLRERPPATGLRAWTPEDHDEEPGRPPGANQGPKSDAGGAPAIVEVTWRNQCASCHGTSGHGDGPQGPMFKASDLSREDWQSKVDDAAIAATIKNGKGRMPKFDIPDDVVRGLVGRIRSFRGK